MNACGSVATIGEPLLVIDGLDVRNDGPETLVPLRLGGAEANTAVALARLGVNVRMAAALGADLAGELILERLSTEGVDVSAVISIEDGRTGLCIQDSTHRGRGLSYYRSGSAAAMFNDLAVAQLDWSSPVDAFHVTGITLAISDRSGEAALQAAARCSRAGSIVSFDPNWRPALWTDELQAKRAFEPLLEAVDWVLCGADEAQLLWGTSSPDELAQFLGESGVRGVVVRSEDGAAGVSTGGISVTVGVPKRLEPVDPTGAGDGFAAGFLYGLISGWDPARSVALGHTIASAALGGTGHADGFPRMDSLGPTQSPGAV